jgi:hypothetical protein
MSSLLPVRHLDSIGQDGQALSEMNNTIRWESCCCLCTRYIAVVPKTISCRQKNGTGVLNLNPRCEIKYTDCPRHQLAGTVEERSPTERLYRKSSTRSSLATRPRADFDWNSDEDHDDSEGSARASEPGCIVVVTRTILVAVGGGDLRSHRRCRDVRGEWDG